MPHVAAEAPDLDGAITCDGNMIAIFTWFFLSPSGRVNRQEFWLGHVGLLAAGGVIAKFVGYMVFRNRSGFGSRWDKVELEYALATPSLVVSLVLFWPLVAILIKRLHDINVSGWWSIAVLATPFLATQIQVGSASIFLVFLVFVGSLPGSRERNRFGQSPPPRRNA